METTFLILSCWLLTYLLHSTAFYGMARLLAKMQFFTPVRAREILWKSALVGGIFTASLQTFSGQGLFISRAEPTVVMETQPAKRIENPSNIMVESSNLLVVDESKPTTTESENSDILPAASLFNFLSQHIYSLIGSVWVLFVLVLAARYVAQRYRFFSTLSKRNIVENENLQFLLFKLCQKAGYPHKLILTTSPNIHSPLAMGYAEICLPERSLTDLSADEQNGMLAHELAHLVRKDAFWLKLSIALETVLFFQPCNKLIRKELDEVTEQLCDEWAVRTTGTQKPLASCLVKVAEWITEKNTYPQFAYGMALHKNSLTERIKRIIKNQYLGEKQINRLKLITFSCLLMLFSAFVLPGRTWVSDFVVEQITNAQMLPLAELSNLTPPPAQSNGDTIRFGKDFMLISKRNGSFDILKGNNLLAKEDYGKYKDDFVVENNKVQILSKDAPLAFSASSGIGNTYWESEAPELGELAELAELPELAELHELPEMPELAELPAVPMAWGANWANAGDDGYTYTWNNGKNDKGKIRFNRHLDLVLELEIDGKTIEEKDYDKHKDVIEKIRKELKESQEKDRRSGRGSSYSTSSGSSASGGSYGQTMPAYAKAAEMNKRNAERRAEMQEIIAQRQAEIHKRNEERHKRNAELHEERLKAHEVRMKAHEEKMREHQRKMKEFEDKLYTELAKDDLLKSRNDKHEIRFDKWGFYINGTKQNDEMTQKYKKMLEEFRGKPMESGSNFVINNN